MVEKKTKKTTKKKVVKKASKSSKSAKKKDTEEVCEVFEVKDKKGKEKEVVACGDMPKEHASKKELVQQDRILKYFFITIGVIVLLVLGGVYWINSVKTFSYRGVEGSVVQEGNLIFYETRFPYKVEGKIIDYYVYIRNDPRKLHKQVPFNGEMDFGDRFNIDGLFRLVINTTEDFNCGGYGTIAFANMGNLNALGIKSYQDPNAACDPEGRYMFLNVVEGDKTEINQIGESCYELSVNNCEILKGTERFMTEAFVYFYDNLEE